MRLLTSLFALLLLTTPAVATTYYVRSDGANIGSTSTTCNGLYDVAYTTGNGPNCAVNSPLWLLRFNGTTSPASVFVGGDTMIIDGTGGAVYGIYYGATGAGSGTQCNVTTPYDCSWKIPAGTSTNHTKIYGKGWDTGTGTKPTLKGSGAIYYGVINLIDGQDYIDFEYFDITDNESCIKNLYDPSTTYPCTTNYAKYGIWGEVNDTIKLKNMDIWGMATGCVMFSAGSNWSFYNFKCRGGGMDGLESDSPNRSGTSDGQSGTMIMVDSEIEYIGCVIDTNNAVVSGSCVGQATDTINAGYGDAFGFADGSMANWIIDNLTCKYNFSDCFDGLHGDGSGSVKITNSLFIGNTGAAVKGSAQLTFENNVIIDDCAWPFTHNLIDPKFALGGVYAGKQFMCRADSLMSLQIPVSGVQHRLIGNTFFGNHDQMLSVQNCASSTSVYARNNIFYGGREFNDDTSVPDPWATTAAANELTDADYFYGTCSGSNFDEDYNIFYNTKGGAADARGAHSSYADPGFTGTIKTGPYDTTGYFSTIDGEFTQFSIGSSAGARNLADETVTCFGDCSSDYNNFSRGTSWDLGALEYNSTATCDANGSYCSFNSDCCLGNCSVNNICFTPGSYLYNITPIGSIKFQ